MKRTKFSRIFAWAIVLLATSVVNVVADDWVATKLRGNVFAFNGVDWDRLERGDIVSDDRVVRTIRSGRVQFTRGAETIDVGGDTQIRIFDRVGQKYTTVQQHYGAVTIEAERKDVKHFAVQTPVLAAVVKGTRFEVRVRNGVADVNVKRGRVEVRDTVHELKVNVIAGQSASAGETKTLEVEGKGVLEPVTTFSGKPVQQASMSASGSSRANANSNASAAKSVAAGAARGAAASANATSKTVNNAASGALEKAGNAANGVGAAAAGGL